MAQASIQKGNAVSLDFGTDPAVFIAGLLAMLSL